jgi:hypothetical protein
LGAEHEGNNVYPKVSLSSVACLLLSEPRSVSLKRLPLPLDYRAFRDHVEGIYQAYAREHLGRGPLAAEAVGAAFDDLAVIWREVLCSARPAALAWHLLNRSVSCRIASPDGMRNPHAHSTPSADAGLLHHKLGFPLEAVAAVMGTDPLVIRMLLSARDYRPCPARSTAT